MRKADPARRPARAGVPASRPAQDDDPAEAIVDMVSTGATLKANHLLEVERIMDISARLVVNQAALKLKREPMRQLRDALAAAVADRR